MGKKLPAWQEDLHKQAKHHLLKTSCTLHDKDTDTYTTASVKKTSLDGIGEVTGSIGVQLYFVFIKRMGFVFLVMFLLSCPMLLCNLFGTQLDPPSAVAKYLARVTVGNIGTCPMHGCRTEKETRDRCLFNQTITNTLPDNTTEEVWGECSDADAGWWPPEAILQLRVKDVTQWLGMLDGIAILFFMVWAIYFKEKTIPRKAKTHDERNLTPTDYTLEVKRLPRKLEGEEEHRKYSELLKEHFLNVMKQMAEPIDDATAIDTVTLVRDWNGAVRNFQAHGEVLLELENDKRLLELAEEKRTAEGEEKKPKNDKRVEKREKNIETRQEQMKKYEKEKVVGIQEMDREVVKAYITFKTIAIKEAMQFEYRYNNYKLFRLCEPERLRFQKAKIQLKTAPEPSDLFWENMDFPGWKRFLRKGVVLIITIILLLSCIIALVYIKASTEEEVPTEFKTWLIRPNQNSSTNQNGCFKLCNWDTFSDVSCKTRIQTATQLHDSTGNYSSSTGAAWNYFPDRTDAVESCDVVWESPGCSTENAPNWIARDFESLTQVKCMAVVQPKQDGSTFVPVETLQVYGCHEPFDGVTDADVEKKCNRMQETTAATRAQKGSHAGVHSGDMHILKDAACPLTNQDEFLKFEDATDAIARKDSTTQQCFCLQQIIQKPDMLAPPYKTDEQKLCEDFIKEQVRVYGMLGLGIVAVVLINFLLKIMFSVLTSFKRLETMTESTRSQLQLLFVAQFINTGLLITLVNWKIATGKPDDSMRWLVDFVQSIVIDTLKIGDGSFYQPDAAWLIAVGSGLVFGIFSQVLSAVATPIVMGKVVAPLQMWWARKDSKRVTLDTLKQVYKYPDFDLGQRSAESLNVIACIITYSGGMPVLYLVGMIYCFFAFWMDKTILLTASAMPPAYDSDIISQTMDWVPVFSFLHVLFALLFLSNPDMFPSDFSLLRDITEPFLDWGRCKDASNPNADPYEEIMAEWSLWSTDEKDGNYDCFLRARSLDFTRQSTWLLMLLFCAGIAFFLLYFLYKGLLKPVVDPFIFAVKHKCCKCCLSEEEVDTTEFSVAKEAMIAKGMPSGYTMADNPKYAVASKAVHHNATLSSSVSSLGATPEVPRPQQTEASV